LKGRVREEEGGNRSGVEGKRGTRELAKSEEGEDLVEGKRERGKQPRSK
jgi:hypothetical protein